MRISALAVAAGLSFAALFGAASAETFHDRSNRISVTAPAGWRMLDQSNATQTYLVLGSASNECDILAVPRAEWASMTAANAKLSATHEIPPDSWVATVGGWLSSDSAATNGLHPPATFVSQSIDSSTFFPSQRGEFTSSEGTHFHAAHLIRPGLEIFAYCMTFSGPDSMSIFDPIIRSIGTPNDAALQTQAQAAPATTTTTTTTTAPAGHH